LTTWPATADGRAFQSNCESVTLCLYQMGRVRSVVGIVDCGNEIFCRVVERLCNGGHSFRWI
jgi:hypothetical protein